MEPSDLFMHLAAVLDVRDLAAEGAFYEKLGLRVSPERVDQRQEGCARAVMESASGLGRLSSVVVGGVVSGVAVAFLGRCWWWGGSDVVLCPWPGQGASRSSSRASWMPWREWRSPGSNVTSVPVSQSIVSWLVVIETRPEITCTTARSRT